MNLDRKLIIISILISSVIIMTYFFVLPPPEPPRAEPGDIIEAPAQAALKPSGNYWTPLNFSAGEVFTFRSTFPSQVGLFTFEFLEVVEDNYTIRVSGELNTTFDKVINTSRGTFLYDLTNDDELKYVGTIMYTYLGSDLSEAYSMLDLKVGSNYIYQRMGIKLDMTVIESTSLRGIECFNVNVYKFKYLYYEICFNQFIGFPVRVRGYNIYDSSISYVISVIDYSKS